ncbi:gustatory receptor 23a isoform X1 [Drosophila obscura]|uniref:gustatory receptor 23a isoform X1 n=1 Tax=Drosophila obscura TaxID=7282 RepID=UPI001BB2AD93|nr:gustatory receptor 23a isoform X1 [Drosophila obscura]
MFPLSKKQAFSRVVLKFLHLTLSALGLSSRLHSRPVQWLQFCCWLCWYTSIWALTLHRTTRSQDCDLDCMLRYVLLVCETGSHAIIVTSTFLQKRCLQQDDAKIPEGCDPLVAVTVFGLLVPILGVQYLVCSNLDKFSSSVISFYWKTLPSLLGLQFQIIAFISQVMNVNIRVRLARRQLQVLSRELTCSWPRSKLQPKYLDHQTARVVDLKRRYNELYQFFYRINENYGGSLLIIFIVFFAGFVCNAYWLFVDVRSTPSSVYPILQNLGFIFNVALQISAACWHCQQSYNLGREIGCLISKLAKPLGSKRYNNLVSQFSLQTLHQRFVVTAKDFFSLNLHLLSSMFAAVVTYLVILIQFMFAERSAKEYSG